MSVIIKRVTADPSQPDTYYDGAAGPPTVWAAAIADATAYASPYLALTDAASLRDGVTGYPAVTGTDHVVLWDEVTGREYPIRGLLAV